MVFTRKDGDFHGRAVSFREGRCFFATLKNPSGEWMVISRFGRFPGFLLVNYLPNCEPGLNGNPIYIYIYIYIYIPGTQMTLVLNGKGRILEGCNTKIEDKQVPGTYIPAPSSSGFSNGKTHPKGNGIIGFWGQQLAPHPPLPLPPLPKKIVYLFLKCWV